MTVVPVHMWPHAVVMECYGMGKVRALRLLRWTVWVPTTTSLMDCIPTRRRCFGGRYAVSAVKCVKMLFDGFADTIATTRRAGLAGACLCERVCGV